MADTTPPKSIWLDATIAVGIASLTSLAVSMAGKESYEYTDPTVRFWLLVGVGFIVQGLHALSKFRDGTFTRHAEVVERQAEADKSGVPSTVTNTVTPKSDVATPPATGAVSPP